MDSETAQCALELTYSLQAVKTMRPVVSQQDNAGHSNTLSW